MPDLSLTQPMYPTIDMSVFKECDWKEFCSDVVKEAIPPNAPESWDTDINILCLFCNSDHAGVQISTYYVCSAIPTMQGTKFGNFCGRVSDLHQLLRLASLVLNLLP
jgi:hypothetical protein